MKTLFIALVLFCGILQAGTIDPKRSDQEYIDYGNKHDCVVKIEGKQLDDLNFFASAVVIDEDIILTAAHITKNSKYAHIVFNNEPIKILLFIVPEEYDENQIGGNGFDLSIGLLQKKVNLSFYPQLYEKTDETDKICSISGFGLTGNFDKGADFSDGKKRAGSNIIKGIEDGVLVCSLLDFPNTQLEFMISNGDSGGGLFIDKKLAGINSSIYTKSKKLNSDRNTFSMHTRISIHYKWIKKVIEEIKNAQSNVSRITGDNGE